MLIPKSEIKRVPGLTDEQRDSIKYFKQGAVYCWVKNRTGEPCDFRVTVLRLTLSPRGQ
jgi:hypothetical protein